MPATLTTAPFGASDPVSTAMPPWAWIGSVSRWTTSPSGAGGSRAARFSAIVRPVTVRQSPWSRPASSSSRITTGTPPMRSRSDMWYLPWGLVSARWGTRAATVLKSSSVRSTRASLAMASRWSTALVEPPRAMTTAMAFSNASLVMIWRGRMPGPQQLDHGLARARRRASSRRRSTAGADELPGKRHAQGLGHRGHGVGGEHPGARSLGRAGVVLDEAELLVGQGVDGVGADRLEHRGDVEGPVADPAGQDRPAVEEDARQVEPGRGHEHARAATCRSRPG